MMCSLELSTYPHLIKEFFKNLRLDTKSIESLVKGIEIILDQRRLGHLLQMPSSGLQAVELSNDFDGMRKLLDRNLSKKFDIHNANLMPIELRLLHSMISQIFFPRT